MEAKISVLRLILSSDPYVRSAMVWFPLVKQKKEKNVRWQAKISDTLFDQRSPVNKKGLIQ